MASGRFLVGNRNLGEGVGTPQGVCTGVMKEHKGQDVLWEVAFLGLGRLHLISWDGVGGGGWVSVTQARPSEASAG